MNPNYEYMNILWLSLFFTIVGVIIIIIRILIPTKNPTYRNIQDRNIITIFCSGFTFAWSIILFIIYIININTNH